MSLRIFFLGLVLATVLAWACLIAIFVFLEPQSDNIVLSFFYLSLFIGVSGLFTLGAMILRSLSQKVQLSISQVKVCFRRGSLLGLVLVGALFLQDLGLMSWWSLLILISLTIFLEYLSMKK